MLEILTDVKFPRIERSYFVSKMKHKIFQLFSLVVKVIKVCLLVIKSLDCRIRKAGFAVSGEFNASTNARDRNIR